MINTVAKASCQLDFQLYGSVHSKEMIFSLGLKIFPQNVGCLQKKLAKSIHKKYTLRKSKIVRGSGLPFGIAN